MNIEQARLLEKEKYLWLSKHNPSYGSTNHGKPFFSYIFNRLKYPLIDIGCGKNNFIEEIRKFNINAIGIDFAFNNL